jgi:ATP-dependent Clp protease protease subunit
MLDKINLMTLGSKTKNDSMFLIFGEIDIDIAQSTVEWILNANYAEEPPEVLTIFINSVGGDLAAAWSIIDVMRGSTVPVRIIGLGQIASAGLLILSAGEKGKRILTENTSVMMHQYSWGTVGKHHELLAAAKEYTLMQTRLINHFKKTTGLSEEEINEKLMPPHDVYMSGEEAKALGICDEVKSMK